MSLLSRLRSVFARGDSSPLDPRRGQGWFIPFPHLPDGIRLSTHQTLEVGTVWACVHLIASSIASAPWNVFSITQGRRERLDNDSLAYLLNVRPNPEVTAQAMKEGLLFQALIHGDSYAEIERDGASRPLNLWPLLSEQMLPPTRDANGVLFYEYINFTGERARLPAENVLHFRGPSIDSLMGVSMTTLAAKSIAHAAAAERFSLSYLANAGTPSGILTSAKPLKPAEADALRAEFTNRYTGPRTVGTPLVLSAGMDWKTVSNDPQKSQLVETQQFSVQAIARWFGVPLQYLGDPAGAQGYGSNIESLGLQFVRFTLGPWTKRLTQEVNYKLIPMRVSKVTEIDLTGLTHGTAKERAEADKIRIESGVMSPNEAREGIGLNHGDDELDCHFMLANMTTVERVVEPPQPPAPAPNMSSPAPEDGEDDAEETDTEDATEPEDGEDPMPNEATDKLKTRFFALALETHARRWRAREKDLRKANTNGTLEGKLAAARKELRDRLAADLDGLVADVGPLADAVEAGVEPRKVAEHHFFTGAKA